jgi:hypothetical protein
LTPRLLKRAPADSPARDVFTVIKAYSAASFAFPVQSELRRTDRQLPKEIPHGSNFRAFHRSIAKSSAAARQNDSRSFFQNRATDQHFLDVHLSAS